MYCWVYNIYRYNMYNKAQKRGGGNRTIVELRLWRIENIYSHKNLECGVSYPYSGISFNH